MRPDLREQCEHAIQVLDAVIARDEAQEAFNNRRLLDGNQLARYFELKSAWHDAAEQAQQQMLDYRARWEHTR